MKTGKKKRLDSSQFKDLLEKYFGKMSVASEVGNKEMTGLRNELDKFSEVSVRYSYSLFLLKHHLSGGQDTEQHFLYNDRKFALKLHNEVFFDLLHLDKDKLKNKRKIKRELPLLDSKYVVMGLIGITPVHRDVDAEIGKISSKKYPVLITGETGTGKELHAKTIHYLSSCRKHDFIAVNSSGIPDTLLESEMFGHEKGAFTDATERKLGLFESVGEGTLFLDEIGDMPMPLQAKLLRVLQDGDFRRLGSTSEVIKFNGRIIAATNKDLQEEINKGRFREDLFYRLNVYPLKLRPFRELDTEQKENIITQWMPSIIKPQLGFKIMEKEFKNWPEDVRECLLIYNYPGNYRELTNILIRAITLSDGGPIKISFLPEEVIYYKKPETEKPETELIDDEQKKKAALKDVRLADIFDHADSIRSSIIKLKVEELYESGQELKKVLQTELGKNFTDSTYQTMRNKIVKTLGGQDPLKVIREKYRKH